MGLRDRLDQRKTEHEVFGRHGTATRLHLGRRLIGADVDLWVADDDGGQIFRVVTDAAQGAHGVVVEDADGTTLCRVGSKDLVLRDSLQVDDADGEYLAIVHRTYVSDVRERWFVSLPGAAKWEIHGSVGRREYEIRIDGRTIAQVSKKGSHGKGTYAVEVAPGENAALLVAVAIAADAIEHAQA